MASQSLGPSWGWGCGLWAKDGLLWKEPQKKCLLNHTPHPKPSRENPQEMVKAPAQTNRKGRHDLDLGHQVLGLLRSGGGSGRISSSGPGEGWGRAMVPSAALSCSFTFQRSTPEPYLYLCGSLEVGLDPKYP